MLSPDDAKRLEPLLGRRTQAVRFKLESGSMRECGTKECGSGFRVAVRLGRAMRSALTYEENRLNQAENRSLKSFPRQLGLELLMGSQTPNLNGWIRRIADALHPVLSRCATGLLLMSVPVAWISSEFGDKQTCYE